MFLRIVADSFGRRPRHKLLTGAALGLGMGVVTAALSVALDVGDRLAKEFRSLGAYLPESDLPKLKTIFWHNNIVAFAPSLESAVTVEQTDPPDITALASHPSHLDNHARLTKFQLLGTWARHRIALPEGSEFLTGIENTSPWWQIRGRWFVDDAQECVLGKKLANRLRLTVGNKLEAFEERQGTDEWPLHELAIVGLLETGGPEDDAIVAPLSIAQQLANKPGQYRKLYVSALTKPEDDFAKRDPKTYTPKEYDRW